MQQGTNVNPAPASLPRARRILLGVVRWAVVLAGLLTATLAYIVGLLPTVLLVALAAAPVWGLGVRLIAVFRGKLTLAPWRRPLDPALRPARLQAFNRALFWAAAGLMLIWIMPAALIEPEEYRWAVVTFRWWPVTTFYRSAANQTPCTPQRAPLLRRFFDERHSRRRPAGRIASQRQLSHSTAAPH